MNNGPALVIRGALLGCVVVCLLVVWITSGLGGDQGAALAAAEPPEVMTVEAVLPVTVKGKAENPGKAQAAVQAAAETKPAVKQPAKKNKAQANNCTLAASYPQDIRQWCQLILKAAERNNLPADLVAALILQESGGQPLAYSHSGAVGLMQVMPRDGIAASFQCVNGPCFASRPTIAELQDPAFNIDYGTRFLASLVQRRGSYREALFAYGPSGVGYYYADKVLAIYAAYKGE